jgi:hypothetical protein
MLFQTPSTLKSLVTVPGTAAPRKKLDIPIDEVSVDVVCIGIVVVPGQDDTGVVVAQHVRVPVLGTKKNFLLRTGTGTVQYKMYCRLPATGTRIRHSQVPVPVLREISISDPDPHLARIRWPPGSGSAL